MGTKDDEISAPARPSRAGGPACSVIVVVAGRPRATARSIRTVIHRSPADVEVVVVDNAAADPVAPVLQVLADEHPSVRVLHLRKRQPHGAAWNAGAAAATGDVVVFLSNTAAVEEGWLAPLVQRLQSGAAVVQPRALAADGTILTTGLMPDEQGHLVDLFAGSAGDEAGAAVAAARAAATPHCFATTPRELRSAGGFAPDLPGGAAVTDLCMRLRRDGRPATWYEPASCIVAQPLREQKEDRKARRGVTHRWGDGLLGREPAPAARTAPPPLRWAIKIAAPFSRRQRWGDFHFATALRQALIRQGQDVVVDAREAWYRPTAADDDVVLVLRGLEPYQPQAQHLNLMWIISHVEDVSPEECEPYDHVFAATTRVPQQLATADGAVESLLQATDPTRFRPGPREPDLRSDVLFVGNSRWQLRPIVRDALAAGLPLSVYGDGWTEFLPPGVLRADLIPNEQLPRYYRSAGVVLNDHWDDMRRHGLLSNRLFDLAACGATVVTDAVDGMAAVFGDALHSYGRPEELGPLVRRLLVEHTPDDPRRLELADHIRTNHSFDARARRIVEVARERHGRRPPTNERMGHAARVTRA